MRDRKFLYRNPRAAQFGALDRKFMRRRKNIFSGAAIRKEKS
jgi:hypothetical protein